MAQEQGLTFNQATSPMYKISVRLPQAKQQVTSINVPKSVLGFYLLATAGDSTNGMQEARQFIKTIKDDFDPTKSSFAAFVIERLVRDGIAAMSKKKAIVGFNLDDYDDVRQNLCRAQQPLA